MNERVYDVPKALEPFQFPRMGVRRTLIGQEGHEHGERVCIERVTVCVLGSRVTVCVRFDRGFLEAGCVSSPDRNVRLYYCAPRASP